MPELPEVETVRAGLEPLLRGRRFVTVEQRRANLRFPLPDRFVERLSGAKVTSVDRRAKYLLVRLDSGEVLAMHLGMTGRFTVSSPGGANGRVLGDYTYDHGGDAKHDHVVFTMSGGAVVTYNDARRFGYMALIDADRLVEHEYFAGLGIEPLGNELGGAFLASRALGRKTDLKAFLMDQRIVAGLGNIYVCEALFRAGLDPRAPAARLATKTGKPTPRAERLTVEIKAVLTEAIGAGGSTLRDYRQSDGRSGSFQQRFTVYGRQGQPCSRPGCRGIVRRTTQAGRSTFHCPVCQR
jgi:formamidopyrimidine-DNA glycosylase